MLRLARGPLVAGLTVVFAVLMAGSALAATTNVSIHNTAFNAPDVKVGLGGTVQWTNNDPFPHTSTSANANTTDANKRNPDTSNGPSLWGSPNIAANGGTFSFVFSWAGTFNYHCEIHTFMQGSVSVKPKAAFITPATGSPFIRITTGTAALPANYVFHVQVSVNGGAFTDFATNSTALKLKMTNPTPGTYQFQVSVEKTSTPTGHSYYAKSKTVTVS